LAAQITLAACAEAAPDRLESVTLRPIPYPQSGDRLGQLQLKAAFEITGASGIGGLSGLARLGDDLFLLSDRSRLFRAPMKTADDGTLVGLGGWREVALPPLLRDVDTEALSATTDGALVIGAENRRDLVRFRPGGKPRAERLLLPPFLSTAPDNEGIEAVAALPHDRHLVVSEGLAASEASVAAALIAGKASRALSVSAPEGFRPTDAASAGDWIFLLQRRLTLLDGGLNSRLVALPLSALESGADQLDGVEIGRFDGRSYAENFEGLTATMVGPGRYRLLIVSDDNFNPLLRSLLLELEWQATPG
jgi:hypothetical protein